MKKRFANRKEIQKKVGIFLLTVKSIAKECVKGVNDK